jgi:hypothetical protein
MEVKNDMKISFIIFIIIQVFYFAFWIEIPVLICAFATFNTDLLTDYSRVDPVFRLVYGIWCALFFVIFFERLLECNQFYLKFSEKKFLEKLVEEVKNAK